MKPGTMTVPSRHVMETEATLSHGWMVQCPACVRRVFVYRDGSPRDIIDSGDFHALHSWASVPGLVLAAAVDRKDRHE